MTGPPSPSVYSPNLPLSLLPTDNNIGNDGVSWLAGALKNNSALTSLDLSG